MQTNKNTNNQVNHLQNFTLFADINNNYTALHNLQPTADTKKQDDFLICIEPDLAAPGRCEFTITSCLRFENIQTEEYGLKNLLAISFRIKDINGRFYEIEERFFSHKPQQTHGRIFDFFSDLFHALGIEGGIDAECLIGETGFATLQYLPSDDGSLSWARLSDFSRIQ
jgi:hypothetical protein